MRVPLIQIPKTLWRGDFAGILAMPDSSASVLLSFPPSNLTTVSARVERSLSVDTGKGWLQLFWKCGIYLYCPLPELFPLNTKGQRKYGTKMELTTVYCTRVKLSVPEDRLLSKEALYIMSSIGLIWKDCLPK